MNAAQPQAACPDEAARLLPWFVNGTLTPVDTQFVETHLAACESCRSDAAALTRMRTLLRSPGQVEHAPHGGLRKLMRRIDAAEGLPQAPELPHADAWADPSTPGTRPVKQAQLAKGRVARWLSAAVVLQSMALVFLGALALRDSSGGGEAAYRTLSTAQAETPHAALRVVFAPNMTLAEVQDLLRVNGLTIQAGPSEAGLFTLALLSQREPAAEQAATLTRLRADPRVRFAEPAAAVGTPP